MDSWSLEEKMGVVKQGLIKAIRPLRLVCTRLGTHAGLTKVCGTPLPFEICAGYFHVTRPEDACILQSWKNHQRQSEHNM